MMRRGPRFGPGIGCLGCLSLGGVITVLFPLILIGALIYWLVNRKSPAPSLFCPHCGKPMTSTDKFCPSCGSKVL